MAAIRQLNIAAFEYQVSVYCGGERCIVAAEAVREIICPENGGGKYYYDCQDEQYYFNDCCGSGAAARFTFGPLLSP